MNRMLSKYLSISIRSYNITLKTSYFNYKKIEE